ncbi:hypothetical protein [Chelativorans xinjiangense]|uniref:hypothetical protein n=1 Tax=Chelativorans xinjiangense TaxID=2681485 RepID=UPI001358E5CD|nr:hypothetical protein [Chelativorans xinjiangense]
MWRFILRENAANYRRLMQAESDGERRLSLKLLVEAAERELTELDEASHHAHAAREVAVGRLLQVFLDDAVRMHKADFGNIQLYEPETQSLLIGAQRNFRKPFLDHFAL